MKLTLQIPDDLAERLGTAGELERELLENLAVQAFSRGQLTRPELCRVLGVDVATVDALLAEHGVSNRPAGSDEDKGAEIRQAIANIIARRKGVTLGGLLIKDLINEGRP